MNYGVGKDFVPVADVGDLVCGFVVVPLGGGLLGWIAGEIIIGDDVVRSWVTLDPPYAGANCPAVVRDAGNGHRHDPCAPCRVLTEGSGGPDPGGTAVTEAHRALIPRDDSPSALRAVEHVIALAGHGLAVEVQLVNVQTPLLGVATALIAQAQLNDYHREEGMKVLAGVLRLLEQGGLPVHSHVSVGDPGRAVLALANRLAYQHRGDCGPFLRTRSMLRLASLALPFQMRQRRRSTSSTISAFAGTLAGLSAGKPLAVWTACWIYIARWKLVWAAPWVLIQLFRPGIDARLWRRLVVAAAFRGHRGPCRSLGQEEIVSAAWDGID